MNQGLEGLEVAETRLSRVDGQNGSLVVAGRSLSEIAVLSFEEVSQLLLGEELPFGEARERVFGQLTPLLPLLKGKHPLEALRTGIAYLPSETGPTELVACFPILLAACRHGGATLPPDGSLSHVADLLRMFHSKPAADNKVKALSCYIATVSEHGMNASTFACRVVASTQATALNATLAGLAALSGPLHGGAPGPVLDLVEELQKSIVPKELLEEKVRRGERLMGFGHRVYKTRDPRAEVLKRALAWLPPSPNLEFAETVESLALSVLKELKPQRKLYTNVEFYTAILLSELGFERDCFTALFASGRILGWMAHYKEQREKGRLMRPKARYVGPLPGGEASRVALA